MRLLTFTGTEAEAYADTITDPNEAQAFRMRWAAVRHAADCLARDYPEFGPAPDAPTFGLPPGPGYAKFPPQD